MKVVAISLAGLLLAALIAACGGDDADIEGLVQAREEARAARDFARADAIRDQLGAMGITLEDGPDGSRWRRRD